MGGKKKSKPLKRGLKPGSQGGPPPNPLAATRTAVGAETDDGSNLLGQLKTLMQLHPPLPSDRINDPSNVLAFQKVVNLVRDSGALTISRPAMSLDGTLYLVWQTDRTVSLVRYGQSTVRAGFDELAHLVTAVRRYLRTWPLEELVQADGPKPTAYEWAALLAYSQGQSTYRYCYIEPGQPQVECTFRPAQPNRVMQVKPGTYVLTLPTFQRLNDEVVGARTNSESVGGAIPVKSDAGPRLMANFFVVIGQATAQQLFDCFARDTSTVRIHFGYEPTPPVNCGLCGVPARRPCTGCANVVYCGKRCQGLHWEVHRENCQTRLHLVSTSLEVITLSAPAYRKLYFYLKHATGRTNYECAAALKWGKLGWLERVSVSATLLKAVRARQRCVRLATQANRASVLGISHLLLPGITLLPTGLATDVFGFLRWDNATVVEIIVGVDYVPTGATALASCSSDVVAEALKGLLEASFLEVFFLATLLAHAYGLDLQVNTAFESRLLKGPVSTNPFQAVAVHRADRVQLLVSKTSGLELARNLQVPVQKATPLSESELRTVVNSISSPEEVRATVTTALKWSTESGVRCVNLPATKRMA